MGAFEPESHALEATLKADELFDNDQVPAFQTHPSSSESAPRKGRKGPQVGLEVQKHLAWSAMHLLFYLERVCGRMAKEVSSGHLGVLNPVSKFDRAKSFNSGCTPASFCVTCT